MKTRKKSGAAVVAVSDDGTDIAVPEHAAEEPEAEASEEAPEQPQETEGPPAEVHTTVGALRDALGLLEPAVPRKAALPSCIYALVGDGGVVATDLQVAVRVDFPEASGAPLCLPYRQAMEWLKRVPGGSRLDITPGKGQATLAAGDYQVTLKTVPARDFPPFASLEALQEAVVDGDALVGALSAARPFVADNDTRPVLAAVCLSLGDEAAAAGADGVRLRWEPLGARLPGEGNLLIPAGSVDVLAHLWKDAPKPPDLREVRSPADLAVAKRLVRLEWEANRLRVRFGVVTMTTGLVIGTYPKYEQLIPREFTAHAEFIAEDLARALKSMARVAKAGANAIRLSWKGDGRLLVQTRADEMGNAQSIVPTIAAEGEGKAAFNLPYLRDYLARREGVVKISLTSTSGPALFEHRGQAQMLLMPLSVQW